ncbi:MAG: tetratricopeptide repeat protein [Candidatus Acidiferrales bacterium]
MPMGDDVTMQAVDATVITPGSDFGPRYRIDSLLGQGGMGRVYKAYDKELDRTVAIKVVREGAISQGDALKRFKQELVLASKISHKNILRIHDMGTVGTLRFISMAYVDGKDLQHVIKDNPKMPLDRTLNFAKQIADALAAAHAEGVVHRDLKPQNLLVDKNDQIYVCDFGLAKSFEEGAIGMTRTGAFLGTPRYMSPEQVEGKPVDNRADLYAFGLILYEMVVGDVPFTGDSTLKVMYQRIQEKPKSPKVLKPDLPNWIVRIIMRCLERDPADRYQNAYEILADIQGSTSGSGVSRAGFSRIGSDTQSVIIQLPRFTERKWIPITAGVVVLLAILFAIPPIRHLLPGFRSTNGSSGAGGVSGIPPILSGKFVAVLPFRVLGDEQGLGYIAEGLNESLTAKLFQIKDLKLAPDSEMSKISPKDTPQEIGRRLGSNLLITGTVQGSPDKMAVIVNLENVAEGKKIWTQQFEGVPSDLLSMEDKISTQLVSALDVKATNEELALSAAHPTENVDAYDLYLRGKNAMRGQQDVKNEETAAGFFQQAIAKDPSFALAYSGLADASLAIYSVKKDPLWSDRALSAAQQAQRLNDNAAEVHFTMGKVYQATGKTSEAIAELQRALKIEPNSDQGYLTLGSVYLGMGRGEEAIAAYQKAIQINEYYWLNYNSLGEAYQHLGDYDKALAAFQKITQLEPDNAAGYDNVGLVLLQQGKYAESISYFQKAIGLVPNYATTHSNLGTAYFQLKRYDEAIKEFEKAVELSPDNDLLVGNLGDAYRMAGQKEKADAAYDQAIKLAYKTLQVNPRSAGATTSLAIYYAHKGDAKQSVTFIERAKSLDKQSVDILYADAEVQALAGHPDEAFKSLRLALQKGVAFSDAKNDPDLISLQSRPEFAQLEKQFGGKN